MHEQYVCDLSLSTVSMVVVMGHKVCDQVHSLLMSLVMLTLHLTAGQGVQRKWVLVGKL